MRKKKCCNMCGRVLREQENVLCEDVLQVKKSWGYFSKKDLLVHEFTICEDCYDKWIDTFSIPVTVRDKTEVLGD